MAAIINEDEQKRIPGGILTETQATVDEDKDLPLEIFTTDEECTYQLELAKRNPEAAMAYAHLVVEGKRSYDRNIDTNRVKRTSLDLIHRLEAAGVHGIEIGSRVGHFS